VRLAGGVDGVSDRAVAKARDGNNIACVRGLQIDFVHPESFHNFHNFALFHNFSISVNCLHLVAKGYLALMDSADEHLSEVLVRLSLVNQHFQVTLAGYLRMLDMLNGRVEQVRNTYSRFVIV